MNIYDVVTKLVGKIKPIGEANTDNERFDNLKVLLSLVDNLLADIDDLEFNCKNSHESSVKRASDLAGEFLTRI